MAPSDADNLLFWEQTQEIDFFFCLLCTSFCVLMPTNSFQDFCNHLNTHNSYFLAFVNVFVMNLWILLATNRQQEYNTHHVPTGKCFIVIAQTYAHVLTACKREPFQNKYVFSSFSNTLNEEGGKVPLPLFTTSKNAKWGHALACCTCRQRCGLNRTRWGRHSLV